MPLYKTVNSALRQLIILVMDIIFLVCFTKDMLWNIYSNQMINYMANTVVVGVLVSWPSAVLAISYFPGLFWVGNLADFNVYVLQMCHLYFLENNRSE